MNRSLNQISVTLFLVLSLFATLWLYHPGLKSEFMLDDRPNLEGLSGITANPALKSTLMFISTGDAGAFGRPLSLLSFAAQHHSWPKHAADFKYVNLMLHMLIGCLVFLLSQALLGLTSMNSRCVVYTASAVTLLWLVHPMQVSTVLYTVQRMTQLSALFLVLGVFLYIKGRMALANNKIYVGYFLATFGLVACGALSVLSKENGILILLFIALIEWTLARHLPQHRLWRLWRAVFIVLPITLGGLYFAYKFNSLVISGYEERAFTFVQRLLTQGRILLLYLINFFIIRPKVYGLFHDDFKHSNSLFDPLDTFICLGIIVGVIGFALLKAKRFPLVSFGILWFFLAHSLESTIFPLELYFEHRNYVAMIGPLMIFCAAINYLWQKIKKPLLRPVIILCLGLWATVTVATTHQESKLWANPSLQAKIWYNEKPHSMRAQLFSAAVWITEYQYDKARETLKRSHALNPEHTAMLMVMVEFNCLDKTVSPYTTPEIINKLKTTKNNDGFIFLAANILNMKLNAKCALLTDDDFGNILTILIDNPALKPKKPYSLLLRGQFNLHLGRYLAALNDFEQSLNMNPTVQVAAYKAHACELLNHDQCAFDTLNVARHLSKRRLNDRLAFGEVIDTWQTQIQQRLHKFGPK